MAKQRFGVGIVGLQPGRSWAARAHIPALRALSDHFEIVGIANTSKASAEEAAEITAAILDGRQPIELSAQQLSLADLPKDWAEQRRKLGFG